MNQGNSGGPTFNAQGEVVGVDTAIFSPSAGSVGIGSAVASDLAKGVVQQLKDNGKVARSWLGVEMMTQDIADSLGLKDAKGAIVGKVEKDSPAAAAGLKDGDVVASVNGEWSPTGMISPGRSPRSGRRRTPSSRSSATARRRRSR